MNQDKIIEKFIDSLKGSLPEALTSVADEIERDLDETKENVRIAKLLLERDHGSSIALNSKRKRAVVLDVMNSVSEISEILQKAIPDEKVIPRDVLEGAVKLAEYCITRQRNNTSALRESINNGDFNPNVVVQVKGEANSGKMEKLFKDLFDEETEVKVIHLKKGDKLEDAIERLLEEDEDDSAY